MLPVTAVGEHSLSRVAGGLRPGDRLDRLLEILLGTADVAQGHVKRVMAHDLSQAVQRDDARRLRCCETAGTSACSS